MRNRTPARIHWEADVPETTALRFQIRWSVTAEQLDSAAWQGPGGMGSHYETSGTEVGGISESARWLQYRAEFVSLYGCRTPKLREMWVEFD